MGAYSKFTNVISLLEWPSFFVCMKEYRESSIPC